MKVTRELCSLNLLAKLMVLHCLVLLSLAIAAVAEEIQMWTSAEQVPSLHRVDPRYLKLFTSSNFWLFVLMSAPMFVLLVMILLFSVVISIPYAVALSMSLLVKSWSSPQLLPIRLMSSANRKLHMGFPPIEMDVWWSWSVFCMIFPRNKLNRMGESKHPYRTPTVVLKNSPSWLSKRTALLEFSYSAWTTWTSPSSMLKLLNSSKVNNP